MKRRATHRLSRTERLADKDPPDNAARHPSELAREMLINSLPEKEDVGSFVDPTAWGLEYGRSYETADARALSALRKALIESGVELPQGYDPGATRCP